jgi:hypothetical protein
MCHTYKSLQNLRSGNSVFRTLAWYNPEAGFTMSIEHVTLSGKVWKHKLSNNRFHLFIGPSDGVLSHRGIFSTI